MKNLTLLVYIILLALLSACKDEEFDLTEDPLDGTLGGNDWIYANGGVAQDINGLMEAIMLDQLNTDPCAIVTTVEHHITMNFLPRRGNYTLSVDNVNVIFNLDAGKKLTATGGFLEVVEITGFEIIGYLSADFDDDNTVQGAFLLEVCN